MNTVNLIGNITAEIEMRYTPAGKAVSEFSIAINERYTNSNANKLEKVHFVNVTAWGKLAELVAEYKKKGDQVAVSGRLNQDRWTAEDGSNRQRLFVVADTVDFLQSKKQGE